jgi:hypothetical protein
MLVRYLTQLLADSSLKKKRPIRGDREQKFKIKCLNALKFLIRLKMY